MNTVKLIEAVNGGQEQDVQLILEHAEGKINQQELQQAFFDSCRHGRVGMAKLLMPFVDINFKMGSTGLAALHVAAQNQQPDTARFLLDHGAEIDIRDNQGHTPLHIAIDSELMTAVDLSDNLGCHIPACAILSAFLIHRGADINAISADGETPLDWALQHKAAEEILLERGAVHGRKGAE